MKKSFIVRMASAVAASTMLLSTAATAHAATFTVPGSDGKPVTTLVNESEFVATITRDSDTNARISLKLPQRSRCEAALAPSSKPSIDNAQLLADYVAISEKLMLALVADNASEKDRLERESQEMGSESAVKYGIAENGGGTVHLGVDPTSSEPKVFPRLALVVSILQGCLKSRAMPSLRIRNGNLCQSSQVELQYFGPLV